MRGINPAHFCFKNLSCVSAVDILTDGLITFDRQRSLDRCGQKALRWLSLSKPRFSRPSTSSGNDPSTSSGNDPSTGSGNDSSTGSSSGPDVWMIVLKQAAKTAGREITRSPPPSTAGQSGMFSVETKKSHTCHRAKHPEIVSFRFPFNLPGCFALTGKCR